MQVLESIPVLHLHYTDKYAPLAFLLRPAPPPGSHFFCAPRPLRPRAPANTGLARAESRRIAALPPLQDPAHLKGGALSAWRPRRPGRIARSASGGQATVDASVVCPPYSSAPSLLRRPPCGPLPPRRHPSPPWRCRKAQDGQPAPEAAGPEVAGLTAGTAGGGCRCIRLRPHCPSRLLRFAGNLDEDEVRGEARGATGGRNAPSRRGSRWAFPPHSSSSVKELEDDVHGRPGSVRERKVHAPDAAIVGGMSVVGFLRLPTSSLRWITFDAHVLLVGKDVGTKPRSEL